MPWGLLIVIAILWLAFLAVKKHIARENEKYKADLIRRTEQGDEGSAALLRVQFPEAYREWTERRP